MDLPNITKGERRLNTESRNKLNVTYQNTVTTDLNTTADRSTFLNKSFLSNYPMGSIATSRSGNKSLVNLSRNRLLETLQTGMLLSLKIAKKQVEYDSQIIANRIHLLEK